MTTAHSKKKKEKYNPLTKRTFNLKLKARWLQKRPILFFVLGFAVLMAVFYVVWLSDFFSNSIHPHIVAANATLSGIILNLFGQAVRTSGEMIFSSRFSISIARGCDGVEAMALFAAALLTFPAPWRHKLIGVLGGVLFLFLLNLVRIVSLFLTGIYFPKAFETMHIDVWQVLFLFFAIGLWAFWIQRSPKTRPDAAH